jgi:hypothetical protein
MVTRTFKNTVLTANRGGAELNRSPAQEHDHAEPQEQQEC